MSRTISPPPIGRRVGLAIMTLCFAVIAGGLGVARTRPSRTADERAEASKSTPQPNAGQARRIEGVVLRPDGKPANGATVVAGIMDATHNHTACTTGTDGRFTFPVRDGAASVYLAVHKAGLAPATRTILPERDQPVEFKLDTPAPFSATLVDSAGRPVGKARVRIEMWAHSSRPRKGFGGGSTVSTSFMHVRREIIDGSPLETVLETVTNPDGSFTLEAVGPESWLRLGVTAADGKAMRVKAEHDATNGISTMLAESGFVEATPDKRVRLVAFPAARVKGRVVTRLPGMRVAELTVSYQGSRVPGGGNHMANLGPKIFRSETTAGS